MSPLRFVLAVSALLAAGAASGQPAGAWTPLNAGATALPVPVASDVDAAGNVYVIQTPPNVLAPVLARWNGTQWTTLRGTFPSFMNDLAVTEAGDAVYVSTLADETVADGSGAAVAIARIARYHIPSATWDNLDGGLDNNVYALDTDGAGNLLAGGWFTQATSGTALSFVARWDQAAGQWEALGGGVSDQVSTATVEPGGRVVFGGRFAETYDTPGGAGQAAGGIARFDPASGQWETLGSGFDAIPAIRGIVSDGTNVTVTGIVRLNGVAQPVYRWNGSQWASYADILDVSVNPLEIAVDGAGTLYVRGFTTGSTVQQWEVYARAAGASGWSLAASAPYGANAFTTIAANPNRAGADLFLGGIFVGLSTPAGPTSAANFARWNGSAWASQQPPFIGTNGVVYAAEEIVRSVTFTPPSISTAARAMAVGGDFSEVAGQPAKRVALYDGTRWDDPGQGVTDPAGVVRAILSTRNSARLLFGEARGAFAPLVIGGTFDEVTDEDGTPVAASNLARWSFETDTWDPMGQGVRLGGAAGTGSVQALAYFPGCSHTAGYVYVGGQFDTATNADGSTVAVRNLARYNLASEQWEGVEGGTAGTVHALKVFNGRFIGSRNPTAGGLYDHVLVVGGRFTSAFDEAGTAVSGTTNIAWLDHEGDWHTLGQGTGGPVFALEGMVTKRFPTRGDCLVDEFVDFSVYVGGAFTNVTGPGAQVPASNLAKWDRSGSGRWEVLGLPFGQASGTPGNGVNGTVRSLQIVEGLTASSGGPITLAIGGDFTEAYDEYGATIAAPHVVRLVDYEPTDFFPVFDEPWTRGAELYASIGGGTDSPVQALGSTTCRVQVGSFVGDSDTYYVGGSFSMVGGSLAAPGLAKWRDFLPPPPPTYVVRASSSRRGSSGGNGGVFYVATQSMVCPAPSLGRRASGGDAPVALGAPAFGETVVTAGTNPPPDTPLRFEITDAAGAVIAVDTVSVETTSPVVFLLTGVDDPGEYAANPDGRDIRLGVRPIQVTDPSLAPDGRATLRFVNAVTDAPPLDVTLPDGTVLADSLVYDSLSTSVRVPFGTPSVEVRRHDDGSLLGTFSLDLIEADAVQVVALAGFLDPAANQNGPPLTLIAVPVSSEGAVADEAAPEAETWVLLPPAPNPARASASVRFAAPRAGEAFVEVVDALGRRVAVLHDGPVTAGEHTVRWDVRGAASGTYLVRLRAGTVSVGRTVTVVR